MVEGLSFFLFFSFIIFHSFFLSSFFSFQRIRSPWIIEKKKICQDARLKICKFFWPIMNFLDHGLTNIVYIFPKKLFEKIYVHKIQAIMDFWAHGLTNIQHTWKIYIKKNISLNHQNLNNRDSLNSWYNKLLVRPTYLDFLSSATQIGGPSHKFVKPRWAWQQVY